MPDHAWKHALDQRLDGVDSLQQRNLLRWLGAADHAWPGAQARERVHATVATVAEVARPRPSDPGR